MYFEEGPVMGERNTFFKYKVGDIIRIAVYKGSRIHHEVHGLIEARLFRYIPRVGKLPHYKIYSDDQLYTERDILGLVPLDIMNPRDVN